MLLLSLALGLLVAGSFSTPYSLLRRSLTGLYHTLSSQVASESHRDPRREDDSRERTEKQVRFAELHLVQTESGDSFDSYQPERLSSSISTLAESGSGEGGLQRRRRSCSLSEGTTSRPVLDPRRQRSGNRIERQASSNHSLNQASSGRHYRMENSARARVRSRSLSERTTNRPVLFTSRGTPIPGESDHNGYQGC